MAVRTMAVLLIGGTMGCYSLRCSAANGDPPQIVSKLLSQYRAVETVRLQAFGDASIFDVEVEGQKAPGVRKVHSDLAYIAKQEKYRIESKWDAHTAPDCDFKIAFDGDRFQQLDRETQNLQYRKGDWDQLAMVSEIPLYFPVQFMNSSHDGHSAYPIKLKYLQDSALLQTVTENAKWYNEEQRIIELPGGIANGLSTAWRVTLGKGDSDHLPTQIEKVDSGGVVLEKIINHAHRAGYEEGPSEGAVDVGKAPLGPLKVTLT